ncbi:MAG: RluA family pseudouridine synthase [Nannocystaceae bacterium]
MGGENDMKLDRNPDTDLGTDIIAIPLVVDAGRDGFRLDRYLSSRFVRLSRNRIHKMIARGRVMIARTGEPFRKPASRVKAGDELLIIRPAPEEPDVEMDYRILYEDDALLALDKPAGLPVHPSARYHRHTLTALMRDRMGVGHGWEMGHRLDRETSGVLVLAQRGEPARALKRAFFQRRVHKEYLALVHGSMLASRSVDVPLGPAVDSRIRIKVGPRSLEEGGLVADTWIEPLRYATFRGEAVTLVRARPRTGRTHQIRVHLEWAGHAVVGDKMYGIDEQRFLDVVEGGRPLQELEAELGLSRHALHAHRLALPHPVSGEQLELEAPWPAMLSAIADLP